MAWRLEDNERRSKIPDHVLIKFLDLANKAAERRAAKPEEKKMTMSVLDAVDKVPPAHAKLMLDAEIERTETVLAAYRQKRKELD